MKQSCKNCASAFEITADENAFLEVVSPTLHGTKYLIPPPQKCPACREQQRFAFRNERRMYRRKCDATGNEIISLYSPDKPYKVYCQDAWWNDAFDPLAYGREFDFSRPFFEQFNELDKSVPKLAIYNVQSENSLYTNYASENKNCYLVVSALQDEDCYYSYRAFCCKNVVDCDDIRQGELCYECSMSINLYNCRYCSDCQNSSDLTLCESCIGCHHCFGCINLRNAEYQIFNKVYEKKDYEKTVTALSGDLEKALREFKKLKYSVPHRVLRVTHCENSLGDYLVDCKNCIDSYLLKNSEDCRYLFTGENNKRCYDISFTDNAEVSYHCGSLEQIYNVLFSQCAWYGHDVTYAHFCLNSHHLFGCSSMKHHQYCVFNKQYSETEYEKLVSRIIEHMQRSNEWGEFFPLSQSPFSYNESIAQSYYPLRKEEALSKGYHWRDDDREELALGKQGSGAPTVKDGEIICCSRCGKNYRLISQEFKFYQNMKIQTPTLCPDCRHYSRLSRRNPRILWKRQCAKCKAEIQTTYAPDRPEIIYCDTCYQQAVY